MNNHPVYFLNTHGVILLILVVLIYEYFVLRDYELVYHILFSVVAAFVITLLLKELFLIPRPYQMSLTEPGAGLTPFSSFPSTHTALSFALATTVTFHQKKFGVLLFMIASLIGLGRVMAYVHYPVDIFFGIMIGVVTGVFFDTLHFRKKRRR